jgi:hypothetical protein
VKRPTAPPDLPFCPVSRQDTPERRRPGICLFGFRWEHPSARLRPLFRSDLCRSKRREQGSIKDGCWADYGPMAFPDRPDRVEPRGHIGAQRHRTDADVWERSQTLHTSLAVPWPYVSGIILHNRGAKKRIRSVARPLVIRRRVRRGAPRRATRASISPPPALSAGRSRPTGGCSVAPTGLRQRRSGRARSSGPQRSRLSPRRGFCRFGDCCSVKRQKP